ncbi:MAG: aldolase [Microlunatus sp.]|nr:aldolase [Microlunatus sp.]
MSVPAQPRLAEGFLTDLDGRLAATDDFLARAYPGEEGRRQPVHTVYVPGDRYTLDLPQRWGAEAAALVAEQGGWAWLTRAVGVADDLVDAVAERAEAKLASEPIEDLRLDFEDGYGSHPDPEEDTAVVAAATELCRALAADATPAFVGLRFKCFEEPTRRRGVRTLDLFLTTVLEQHGSLPEGLVITFPKVSTVSQVEAMVAACEAYEAVAGLPSGRLGFEIQVETPQLIVGPDGRALVAAALHAGSGRVTSLHYGTYDYSASLGVAAEYQSMEHPVADYAKDVMQVAVAGTGVHLSDGSTNILPVGTAEQILSAWRLHYRLIRRSLERAIYQGWDLHPAQLPTRFIATIAFYREGFGRAAGRLRAYLTKTGGGVLDEPATARALARYLYRGYACGAVTEAEVISAVGLDAARLELLSRPKSDTENVVPTD